ncbi:hypothetical protein AR158_c591L [Paramecium bursaria Chlorella virus AR158]|uniref:hypothetical protein n=1 Tax=Paramecium bursaria Chlorella virus AR158 TaxID=380598 RepID=UPI00015AA79D|nr:hypothetical protein AR158_c591L [Paramecium bursaria Chlorella virus AR158]ABU44136.1 hypothetical protein AR158_c591L [Paramecium bursaria Chlorella virus AR158]
MERETELFPDHRELALGSMIHSVPGYLVSLAPRPHLPEMVRDRSLPHRSPRCAHLRCQQTYRDTP